MIKADPTLPDTDNDGIGDKEDKQPKKYNISDYTLSLVAGISYKDSKEDILSAIGSNEFKHLKEFELRSTFFSRNSHFWEVDFDASFSGVAFSYKGNNLIAFGGTNNYIDWLYANPELASGLIKTEQIDCANDFYNRNFNKKTYLCGHSLGGRLVQEIVYRCNDFNAPLHAITFNALGYNKIQKSVNSAYEHIIRKNNITKIITNYYIKFDFVGEGLGHSLTFERYGEDKPYIYKICGRCTR